MNSQLKKGTLELCTLCLLSNADMYGFELAGAISKHIEASEGTIYPLLKRIKDDGLVTTYLQESQEGPPRKYYALTDRGRKVKKEMAFEWQMLVKGMEAIMQTTGGN